MDQKIAMNPNRLVQYLQKPAAEFTRADIIRYCEENQIPLLWLGRQAEDLELRDSQPRTPREHPHRW